MLDHSRPFIDIVLEAHKKSQEMAIERSIRTGVPLVVSRNGKITYIQPKFKYIRVPIDFDIDSVYIPEEKE